MKPTRIALIALAMATGVYLLLDALLRQSAENELPLVNAPPDSLQVSAQDKDTSVQSTNLEDPPPSHSGHLFDRRPVRGPQGRVLETGSDRPVEGVQVTLGFGAKTLAETVTDSGGFFSLPEPERKRRTVRVVTEDWRVTPGRIKLDEEQRSGATELIFRAERIQSAPLVGALRDVRTGEPIPDFLIEARGPFGEAGGPRSEGAIKVRIPRRGESVVTDAHGQFRSRGGFEAGVIELALIDHPWFSPRRAVTGAQRPRVEHDHTVDGENPSSDMELAVRVGPTYRIDAVLPEGLDVEDFHVAFPHLSNQSREMHRLLDGDSGSPFSSFYGAAAGDAGLQHMAPLRGDDPPWVRFRDPVRPSEDVLHVRSGDGYWWGSAPVPTVEGVCATPVPVALEHRGVLEGVVRNEAGKPISSAWVQVFSAADSNSPIREVGADAKGGFTFRWFEEGEYEVVVLTDRYEDSRSAVSVVAGATERLEVQVRSGVALGPVSGALRSRTGQHRSKGGIVTLESLDGSDFSQLQTVWYRKREGEYRAEFSFEDVPSGTYELSLRPLDNMRWDSLRMTVSPPAEGLEFLCEDDVPTFDLELRAIDASTDQPISKAWHIVWQGDPLNEIRLDDDWESGIYEHVPERVPLRWMLRADGYRSATGDETSIRAGSPNRIIEARLERGWGQLFKLTTAEGEPLEGVELIADGASRGVTDAQGMIALNLDAKPGSLEFRYGDWIVTWGSVDPTKEDFGSGIETPVYMGPRD